MNLMNRFAPKKEKLQLLYSNPELINTMSKRIISWLPAELKEYVVVCIGTDRSTGDALGPFTGSFLSERKPEHLYVYGTLQDPVHAKNLEKYIKLINIQHPNSFIIAIDASLGKTDSVGSIIGDLGSLQPGAALNKELPSIGDVQLTGVVNVSGFMEYAVLQSTRLSLVVDMAKGIANTLYEVDRHLATHANAYKVIPKEKSI